MTDRQIIRVKDVMKRDFDMVDGLMTISQTLQKMKHVDTKCVIVNKRHPDDAYGVVLEQAVHNGEDPKPLLDDLQAQFEPKLEEALK